MPLHKKGKEKDNQYKCNKTTNTNVITGIMPWILNRRTAILMFSGPLRKGNMLRLCRSFHLSVCPPGSYNSTSNILPNEKHLYDGDTFTFRRTFSPFAYQSVIRQCGIVCGWAGQSPKFIPIYY